MKDVSGNATAKKNRYRVRRGEPGHNLVTVLEGGQPTCENPPLAPAPPSASALPDVISERRDPHRERASEECPWRKLRDKQIRPGQPCSDSFCPEQYCVQPRLRLDDAPGRRVGSLPEPNGVAWRDPARLSCLTGVMESIERNRRLNPYFLQSIAANLSAPTRRSRVAVRLRLLWLNFFLIPTRIRYTLRRKDRGSYRKMAITNQVEGQ